MGSKNRDDFTEKTKLQIAKRAGWLCSDPSCRRATIGANSDGDGEINLGTAAHICAAAPDGPRYDPHQTPQQRRSAENGIWMCRLHGTSVDARDSAYTVDLLREWKATAQRESWRRVLYSDSPRGPLSAPRIHGELSAPIRVAATADLDVFRRSDKWPSTTVALTLQVPGLGDAVSTSTLASALTTFDDLILVAPPGMGKTATVFQIAESVLATTTASPIVIPLGDWSADNVSLLEFVLKRPAFRGISEAELHAVAASPGVILLLDGWNELDSGARKRAAVNISRLRAELPELSLLISTRQQVLDVPVEGTRVNLLPLHETQQLDIAKTLRGDAGARMVDRARRTDGLRELVAIPLYLTALLALPEEAPFPTTKEEVLRRFVAAHEENTRAAESLAEVTHGLHQRFLQDLAKTAIRAMNTTIAETVARRSVSETDDALVAEGQITEKPQPSTVLESLVSQHVLVRVGDPPGYSFQHQQFLEWYASHFVERLMLGIGNAAVRARLKTEVLNQPAWEEAILFACERLARGTQSKQEACAAAILAAFEVDPMLAAEIIYRSNDAVWARVAPTIEALVRRWHTFGRVDRGMRFMISSGRPEFLEEVWPLITHANDQVHLRALRVGRQFRPSILGPNAAKRIAALSAEIRKHVASEIAFNGGIDGLDLAAAIAKDDPDPEVKASVVEALAFRGADRHAAEVLRSADDATFDLVVRKDLVDETIDERVTRGMEAARERQRKKGFSTYDRLRAILRAQGGEHRDRELIAVIAEMDIDKQRDGEVHLLYEARTRHSRTIAEGILQRVRAGRTLFYGADDLLAAAGFSLEDDAVVDIALSNTRRHDDRAEAAASVLGPHAVGRLIDTALDAKKRIRDARGKYDEAAGDRYHALLDRLAHTPGGSLVDAIHTRSARAGNEEMADLAELISHHPGGDDDRGRPFSADALATIRLLAEDWGNRMLTSADAMRVQLASIATLASRAPSITLLPLLKRLLDENLRCYRAFREEATASGWRQGRVTDEARTPHTHEFQRAFDAIKAPETNALVREYLTDEYFGERAARVLAAHWAAANEPTDPRRLRTGIDFSRVREKRAARASNPTASSEEADAIFTAIEPFVSDQATEQQKKHAIALGIVAARLPHGQRDSTIQSLLSLAPRRSRAALLLSLVVSGESIDMQVVKQGIEEVFEAAKTHHWILSESSYDLREWLRLLPFATPASEATAIVLSLPDDQRSPLRLEEMILAFGAATDDESEDVLFQLAEGDPSLYANHTWRNAVLHRGTLSAARRFVDLAANGAFEDRGTDQWHLSRQLGSLMSQHPQVRAHVYKLLRDGVVSGFALLAHAVAENPDEEGLMLLITMELKHKRSFTSPLMIENVVTTRVASEDWQGAYDIVPVPAVGLRRELLSIATDGGAGDVAARCLKQIDKIRDEYGIPDSEPRHPDIASGKSWPIIASDANTATRVTSDEE